MEFLYLRHLFGLVNISIFWVSLVTFLVLNIIENLLHYSIGRSELHDSIKFEAYMPTRHDFVKILIIMLIFGLLQAVLTTYFTSSRF